MIDQDWEPFENILFSGRQYPKACLLRGRRKLFRKEWSLYPPAGLKLEYYEKECNRGSSGATFCSMSSKTAGVFRARIWRMRSEPMRTYKLLIHGRCA